MYSDPIESWLRGDLKVATKGNLVLCGSDIYSYQMKIGEKLRDGHRNFIRLVDKEESPSVTTSKHLGLVRNAAIAIGLSIVVFPSFE